MEGAAERTRVRVVRVKQGAVSFLGVEDLIADRMGQYASDPAHGDDMIGQARALFDLAGEIDETYLDKRIRRETLDSCKLETLKQWPVGKRR